ncbi:MAG: hypothetical protein RIC87_02165 [Kiloniellales bacterium]
MRRLQPSEQLRLRPVPEMDLCLAYLRRPPRLLRLNLEAWALIEAVETCANLARQEAAILRLLDDCGWQLNAAELAAMLQPLEEQGLLVAAPEAAAAAE